MLNISVYNKDSLLEVGIDEVGRGPMLGRVYTAGVVLPKNNFKFEILKDSKKFSSEKKLREVGDYIKKNCIKYSIQYEDEKVIDELNIKNATYSAMHKVIKELDLDFENSILIIDGNDFKPYIYFDKLNNSLKEAKFECKIGGDSNYCHIAAASILAKIARDDYIYDLCNNYPKLNEYYDLKKNKGYGTKKHMDGIKQFGISEFHRKTFGICQNSDIININ